MTQPPRIDQRNYDHLVAQTEALAQQLSRWRPRADGQPDAGSALVRIFARMAELVSDRLNQVPQKNFLAFLDLIGTQIHPPQPAKVPLTFYLATGRTEAAFVPANTQVAAPAAAGEAEDIVFETERELVVTPAQLTAVCVRQPDNDCYSDYSDVATGVATGATTGAIAPAFPAFSATQPIKHALYLAADDLLTIAGPKTITFTLQTENLQTLQTQDIRWAYWDGQQWQPLTPTSRTNNNNWEISLTLVEAQPIAVDGVSATWLKAQRISPLPPALPALPTLSNIRAQVQINQNNLSADQCFFNATPIDLSKDFYPFGEQPRFNDTFYIASQKTFVKSGQTITFTTALSEGVDPPAGDAKIIWEAWTGSTWEALTVPSSNAANLKASGSFTLTLPTATAATEINGINSYWMRARIVSGNYGEAAKTVESGVLETTNTPIYRLIAATYKPPALKSLTLSYRYEAESTAIACRTYNDFIYINPLPTIESVVVGSATSQEIVQVVKLSQIKGFSVGDRLRIPSAVSPTDSRDYTIQEIYPHSQSVVLDPALPANLTAGTSVFRYFKLFNPTGDQHPALYLGFDRPFSNRATTLYVQVEPPAAAAVSIDNRATPATAEPARLRWEYYSSTGWQPLGARDETHAFSERGMVQFVGPVDLVARADFARPPLYWLRSSWYTGQFRVLPQLNQLRTNTIWASQAQTLTQETLGSSTGNPHQRFQTTQFPVLPGQDLAVRVAQLPSALEQADIRSASGEDAITLVHDEVGQLEEVWIRWQAVPDFYGSSGRDRHYTLNHLTGEVCFGDGQNGSVPPPGLNNIRLMHYRTGGGQQGNRAADTITQLKTTVPYIDRVTNGEAATGGAEQESLAQVQARGPKQLRHRGRAVTAQDFEDLAFEASPEVARALAITPRFDALGAQSGVDLWLKPGESPRQAHRDVHAGQVSVLIVPRSEAPQPVPSLALIDRVEAFIRSSCVPTLSVQVSGPRWIEVLVSAEVVPQSLETGDAVRTDIIYQLNRFLHPLTGGADGQGWDFGREPHESDFYGLMESVAGVVRVRSLQITLTGDRSLAASPYLIFPGRHQIHLGLDPVSSSSLVSSPGGV